MSNDIIAGVFGKIFSMLAENPEKNITLAEDLWDLVPSYEFDLFLMGCDESLVKLGLAERGPDGFMQYK
jgi:hypothetical protein